MNNKVHNIIRQTQEGGVNDFMLSQIIGSSTDVQQLHSFRLTTKETSHPWPLVKGIHGSPIGYPLKGQ